MVEIFCYILQDPEISFLSKELWLRNNSYSVKGIGSGENFVFLFLSKILDSLPQTCLYNAYRLPKCQCTYYQPVSIYENI